VSEFISAVLPALGMPVKQTVTARVPRIDDGSVDFWASFSGSEGAITAELKFAVGVVSTPLPAV
jgi:hypothetical protein